MTPRNVRGCRVAVVGGAGFLGSHLTNLLIQDRGCRVIVLDNLSAGKLEYVHKDAKWEYCDITNSETYLRRLFTKYKVDFVFNYAAIPYIPVSFERPLYVFDVNAVGAAKVVSAAHEAGAKGILQVSSAELYGGMTESRDSEDDKITEDFPVEPHSTYGAAKAAIDYLVQVRWREAKVPCLALRQFNCVGERETHPYVIPEIISQIARWELNPGPQIPSKSHAPAVMLGNNSSRDFLYAGDAVRIAVELLERGEYGEVYNLGSEQSIKIYDLAQRIGKVMGHDEVHVIEDPRRKRPWEIWALCADCTKIQAATNYQRNVITSLDEALRRTVDDYRACGGKWAWER